MKYLVLLVCLISALACSKRSEYLIQIPSESSITSEEILTELENSINSEPENDRLIKQQLYFCEQLGWPARCEQVLIRAKDRWGMTEKLIDHSIAYYQKYKDFERVAALLNGTFETRGRLETKIEIASNQTPGDYTYLERYINQYSDEEAKSFAANIYLNQGDKSRAAKEFEELFQMNPTHRDLVKYYPILEQENDLIKSIHIIEYQLIKDKYKDELKYDLARNYYKIDSLTLAKKILNDLDSEQSKLMLIKWFKERQEWDSALVYIDTLLELTPDDKEVILAKAKILESKGWVTPSLPYYERAFAMDTTDFELAQHLQIVKRKVAYLRRKKEQEERLLPPSLERKTGN